MLTSDIPGRQTLSRRDELRALDAILGELETLNLQEIPSLPRPLGERLRSAGVVYRRGATVSEIIDQVFKAQEAHLQAQRDTTRRRPAA